MIAALAAAGRFNGISRIAAHAYLEIQDSVFCFWKSSHNNQPLNRPFLLGYETFRE
jgi:hypothetical protein